MDHLEQHHSWSTYNRVIIYSHTIREILSGLFKISFSLFLPFGCSILFFCDIPRSTVGHFICTCHCNHSMDLDGPSVSRQLNAEKLFIPQFYFLLRLLNLGFFRIKFVYVQLLCFFKEIIYARKNHIHICESQVI